MTRLGPADYARLAKEQRMAAREAGIGHAESRARAERAEVYQALAVHGGAEPAEVDSEVAG